MNRINRFVQLVIRLLHANGNPYFQSMQWIYVISTIFGVIFGGGALYKTFISSETDIKNTIGVSADFSAQLGEINGIKNEIDAKLPLIDSINNKVDFVRKQTVNNSKQIRTIKHSVTNITNIYPKSQKSTYTPANKNVRITITRRKGKGKSSVCYCKCDSTKLHERKK